MEQRILKMKDMKVREDNGRRYLEGYFAVFGASYHVNIFFRSAVFERFLH